MYTFHARLCQVIGNFFPDGHTLYGYPSTGKPNTEDNGHWHFRIGRDRFELLDAKPEWIERAIQHKYWTNEPNIFATLCEQSGVGHDD